jgi:hypothetical protein
MGRRMWCGCEVKMGKLFEKVLWTPQNRVMKGKAFMSKVSRHGVRFDSINDQFNLPAYYC